MSAWADVENSKVQEPSCMIRSSVHDVVDGGYGTIIETSSFSWLIRI